MEKRCVCSYVGVNFGVGWCVNEGGCSGIEWIGCLSRSCFKLCAKFLFLLSCREH